MASKEVRNWQDQEALKRLEMITPLMDPDMDDAKRCQMREEIAEKNNITTRSLYRYEKYYRENSFDGLRPMNRQMRRSAKLPGNYDEIVAQAIQLKREVPRRSVRQIIKILEIEGWAPPGILKASTLQRYLYKAGLGNKQMRKFTESRETSSRRFCRPHRMELLQGDIKYGPQIRDKDGKLIKTYLSSLIDDHSRYILQSEFYDNQRAEIVEDTFHKAILKHGAFDTGYLDNGTQYISEQLQKSCGKLGIRLLHAKPRNCEAKGKIEKFHQKVDSFIAEIRVAHVHSVEELNERWKYYLEEEYQKEGHDGIREYYEAMDVKVPSGGISPEQEWNRDTRKLTFIDVGTVSEAFMHHEMRQIDKTGCFSFGGRLYEASTALAGAEVEIIYDPLHTAEIEVRYQGIAPIKAKPVRIGAFADKKPVVPVGMTDQIPKSSRLLDALEKKYKENHRLFADAISFAGYGKEG
ncbi:DDE-type integrase/transposase/recombinase [Butyrivibrio sp. MC2013]|uniref:DDE-type integrase/transposase/recombinase n=1 Tax=Butyrivibrio sp. MC2013 TaxID=1280686 RepID=UPI00040BA5F9|nr:DDE-type integrase/transposase/recombinase [Butyrivibrio sp. MC2013]